MAERSKTCSPRRDSSSACAAPVSGGNGLKAGACPHGKSLAEHVSKLHPLQPNQAKWEIFSPSGGKQTASLLSSLSFFSLGESKHYSGLFFSLGLPQECRRATSPQWSLALRLPAEFQLSLLEISCCALTRAGIWGFFLTSEGPRPSAV